VQREFIFYGAAKEFVSYQGAETIIHGPAETGKTISALWKLHLCALKYPGASIVIARKTISSSYSTVLQTFQNKVLIDEDSWGIKSYGGEKAQWFDYDNGSRIWIAGLDKSSKILSAEHDIIYVNQAEEINLSDWEVLTTRTTGRAGNMPYAQTIGDMNPAWPSFWAYHRESLFMPYSVHKDNPVLYDPKTGKITEQGKKTMSVLEALTGIRRDRLLLGKPAQAEGSIYTEWNDSIHLIDSDKVPTLTRFAAGQDWGYTNAGVLAVWGMDRDDNMYLVAQIYHTGKRNDWWIARAKELHKEFKLETIECDPAEPEFIDNYCNAGLPADGANNEVRPGIDRVKVRLAKPALFIVRDSSRFIDQELLAQKKPYRVQDEFPEYVWADKQGKEIPVKENDHGMDMTKYIVAYIDRGKTNLPKEQPSKKSNWQDDAGSGSRWRRY